MGYDISFSGKFTLKPSLAQEKIGQLRDIEHDIRGEGFPDSPCHWIVSEDGRYFYWNEQEKFDYYEEWLTFLLETFFNSWQVTLKGIVSFDSQDGEGTIKVKNRKVLVSYKEPPIEEDVDYWINEYQAAEEGSDYQYYALSQMSTFAEGDDLPKAIHFYLQEFANVPLLEVKRVVIGELRYIVENKSLSDKLLNDIIEIFRQALLLSSEKSNTQEGENLAFDTIIAIGSCKENAGSLISLILPWLRNDDLNIIHYTIRTLKSIVVAPTDQLNQHIAPFLTHTWPDIKMAAQELLSKCSSKN